MIVHPEKLETCHPKLQAVINAAGVVLDINIIEGHRSRERQRELYEQRKTQVLESKHNASPSLAVDIAPHPIDWKDLHRFFYQAGVVKGVAKSLGVNIRWGGDWDSDNDFRDQSFNDYVHFEVIP